MQRINQRKGQCRFMYEVDREQEILKYLPLVERVANRISIKNTEYEYDDISIDLSAFAFLNEDYQQFEGQCIFDNGTSSIINQLEIKDGEVISLHMIQKTHLDVVANLSANVDDYVQQLQVLYDDIVGVKAEVYLEDDAVISDLQIDVAKLDDKALALLDISKDGNELMQKYQAKGYRCQQE